MVQIAGGRLCIGSGSIRFRFAHRAAFTSLTMTKCRQSSLYSRSGDFEGVEIEAVAGGALG
jgi:hypothetical protein